ncbi:MAG TPA: glycoside hydrolase family 15 protein [Symbiobacteriaceae bacterium]
MKKTFLINAILGNGRLLATLTGDGEIQRIFWPHVDGPQHVQRLIGGVAVDGEPVIWPDDSRWQTEQAYEHDQNVLATHARLPDGLTLSMTDAAAPGRDVLVRHLTFTNGSGAPMAVRYVLYEWLRMDESPLYNTALYDPAGECFIHYRRDAFIAAGADRPPVAMTVGGPEDVLTAASAGVLGGGTIQHGDVAAAGVWDLGILAPGASATLNLFWTFGSDARAARALLLEARRQGGEPLLDEVRAYWAGWLAGARRLGPGAPEAVDGLYRRSLLIFKLMADEHSGSIIAAPEFDPAYTSCGGYGYCWGRDAAYVTVAMDRAGLHDLAEAFYRWTLTAQEPEGWWVQRHYAGGGWGPSWGLLQVDETGSILYGMALHARLHGGAAFARLVRDAVLRAAEWLIGSLDTTTGLPVACFDLWEERQGFHTYSAAAVYAGLMAAAELAELADLEGDPDYAVRYRAAAAELKAAIFRESVRDGTFLRSRYMQVHEQQFRDAFAAGRAVRQRTGPLGYPIYEINEDPVPDTSLLGLAVPFGVVDPGDAVMARTAGRVAETLTSAPAGGLRRYQGDHYRGGNPWVLCTLWLGLYEAERGEVTAAGEILDWAVRCQTSTGLLPEQVDPETGVPVWVVPLTWSHAMFVLLAIQLYG